MASSNPFFWLYFGLSGRVNRSAYVLALLLLIVIQLFFIHRSLIAEEESSAMAGWVMALYASVAVSIWCHVALAVKRLHDIGYNGLFSVVLFVPVLSLVAFMLLCVWQGDPGPNRYGRQTNAPS